MKFTEVISLSTPLEMNTNQQVPPVTEYNVRSSEVHQTPA